VKRILVADDEPDIIDILTFRFKKWGYEIIPTVDGQQALDKIREVEGEDAKLLANFIEKSQRGVIK